MREDRSLMNPRAAASYAQKLRAAALGLELPPKTTSKAADALIREAQAKAAPSQELLALAEHFEVEVASDVTFGELDAQVRPLAQAHAIVTMRRNLALRAGKIIAHEGLPYEITFIGGVDGNYVADLKPLAETGHPSYSARQVLIIAVANAAAIEPSKAMALLNRRRMPVLVH